MIIDFKVKNFKSINSEVDFSLAASKDDAHVTNTVECEGFELLKSAAIYGANGSGKTTLINAIAFMQAMVVRSFNHQIGDSINVPKHKMSLQEPSSFDIQYIYKQTRYAYGFVLENGAVVEEYLYYFPAGGRQNKIFERKNDDVSFGANFVSALKMSRALLKPNKLLLSCAANCGETSAINIQRTQIVIDAYLFFKTGLVIHNPHMPSPWINYTILTLQKDNNIKNVFTKLMNGLGSDLVDLTAKFDRRKILAESFPKDIPADIINFIVGLGEANIPNVVLDYGKFKVSLEEESSGIQKLFDILCPIIDIVREGKVLLYDELETSLHESIAKEIINLFLNSNSGAQLIFATHDTNLLDLDLFRRDQIWFTELKKNDRSTDLYSLSDVRNVRKDENVSRGYVLGRYGAIPILNKTLLDDLMEGRV